MKTLMIKTCRDCPHRDFIEKPWCDMSNKELPNKASAAGGFWGTDEIPEWCELGDWNTHDSVKVKNDNGKVTELVLLANT